MIDSIAHRIEPWLALLARTLMAVLFFMAGASQIGDVKAFTDTLAQDGVPTVIGGLVCSYVLVSGVLLMLGAATRLVALSQAGFCIVSGLLAYSDLSQPTDMVMLLKNIALTGGFLFVFLHGPGRLSVDAWRAGFA